jgi:hypothetical protein
MSRNTVRMLAAAGLVLGMAGALLLAAGCAEPSERLNSPPQGWTERQAELQQHFVYMVDNAMLAEMAISDVHFYPHREPLNALGARRLDRYAELLKQYGGTLHYDTTLTDTALVEGRIENVRKYLDAAGVDLEKVTVELGPVQTTQFGATEAMTARKNVSVKEQKEEGGGVTAIPVISGMAK